MLRQGRETGMQIRYHQHSISRLLVDLSEEELLQLQDTPPCLGSAETCGTDNDIMKQHVGVQQQTEFRQDVNSSQCQRPVWWFTNR